VCVRARASVSSPRRAQLATSPPPTTTGVSSRPFHPPPSQTPFNFALYNPLSPLSRRRAIPSLRPPDGGERSSRRRCRRLGRGRRRRRPARRPESLREGQRAKKGCGRARRGLRRSHPGRRARPFEARTRGQREGLPPPPPPTATWTPFRSLRAQTSPTSPTE